MTGYNSTPPQRTLYTEINDVRQLGAGGTTNVVLTARLQENLLYRKLWLYFFSQAATWNYKVFVRFNSNKQKVFEMPLQEYSSQTPPADRLNTATVKGQTATTLNNVEDAILIQNVGGSAGSKFIAPHKLFIECDEIELYFETMFHALAGSNFYTFAAIRSSEAPW